MLFYIFSYLINFNKILSSVTAVNQFFFFFFLNNRSVRHNKKSSACTFLLFPLNSLCSIDFGILVFIVDVE